MAAPIVAGAAALMLEKEPNLQPDTIKARLMRTAEAIPGNPLEHGAGRINVSAALTDRTDVLSARSPRVLRAAVCCELYVEDLSVEWGAGWDASAIWGDSTLWSDTTMWGESTIWGDTTMWGETAMWGESAMWSDSVVIGE
jgi:subtilisin family serine protease